MTTKLTRLRNWQSQEFWARLFARPLCIVFLYPIVNVPWVTPNLITHVGNLFFAAGIAAILLDWWILAAVLLNLHLVFDNMDGTLARYRDCGSHLGNFYDKISDAVGISAMFLVLGWAAFRAMPDQPHLILVGGAIAVAELLGGYSKWLTENIKIKTRGPEPATATGIQRPPHRSFADWIKWFLVALIRIYRFEEVDYFFWVGLALIVGRLDWVLYLLCVARLAQTIGALVIRGLEITRLDN